MVAAAEAYEDTYGEWPVYTRSGGSIPIVEVLGRVLDAPVVLMGFGLPGENLHAPNEHFHLMNWDKGTETISRYWLKLAACMNVIKHLTRNEGVTAMGRII